MVNIALKLPNVTIHTAVICHLIYHGPLWFTCLIKLSTCFDHFSVRHQLLANCFLPFCSDYHFLKSTPPAVSSSSCRCLSCLGCCWCCGCCLEQAFENHPFYPHSVRGQAPKEIPSLERS